MTVNQLIYIRKRNDSNHFFNFCKIINREVRLIMSNEINERKTVEQKINEEDVSVYAYDKAIVEDLKARFRKTDKQNSKVNQNVQIGPLDQMFNIIGSLEEDNVIMPFVGLQRLDWQLNLDRQRISNLYRR